MMLVMAETNSMSQYRKFGTRRICTKGAKFPMMGAKFPIMGAKFPII